VSAGPGLPQREAAERHGQGRLERALIRAFWGAMQQGQPMPMMAALEAAARTVGTLYRQAAAAHGPCPGCGCGCGCGWQPDADADLIVLEAMLAAAALQPPVEDLAGMAVAGRA